MDEISLVYRLVAIACWRAEISSGCAEIFGRLCSLSLISANSWRVKFYIPLLLVFLPLLSSLFVIFSSPLPPSLDRCHRPRRRRAKLDDRFINGVSTSRERHESMYSISLARIELQRWRQRCEKRRRCWILEHVLRATQIYEARNLSVLRENPFRYLWFLY